MNERIEQEASPHLLFTIHIAWRVHVILNKIRGKSEALHSAFTSAKVFYSLNYAEAAFLKKQEINKGRRRSVAHFLLTQKNFVLFILKIGI